MNELSNTLKAVLYRIASMSPMHTRVTELTYVQKGRNRPKTHKTKGVSSEWSTPEHHLVWSIYERAVYDHFGLGTGTHGFGRNPVFRNETAKTGLITLSTGKSVNVLELLGIDPDWARAQIKTAITYNNKKAA